MSHPIEGQMVMLAATKASIAGSRLPELLDAVQAAFGPDLDVYRRRYELAGEDDACYFFVPADHWEAVGADLGLDRREHEAVQRAHEAQLQRFSKREGRSEEFETALELRSAVVIGK